MILRNCVQDFITELDKAINILEKYHIVKLESFIVYLNKKSVKPDFAKSRGTVSIFNNKNKNAFLVLKEKNN